MKNFFWNKLFYSTFPAMVLMVGSMSVYRSLIADPEYSMVLADSEKNDLKNIISTIGQKTSELEVIIKNFFDSKNNESLTSYKNNINEKMNSISTSVIAPLQELIKRSENRKDYHSLLILLQTIVVDLYNTIKEFQSTLESSGTNTASLAKGLQAIKQSSTTKMKQVEQNINMLYNIILPHDQGIAHAIGLFLKKLKDLKAANSGSSITLLKTIQHRVNC